MRDRGKGSNGVFKRGWERNEFPSPSALKGAANGARLTRGSKKAMSEETKVGFTVIIGTRNGGVIIGMKDMGRIVEGNLLKEVKKLIKDAGFRGEKVKLRTERGNEVKELVVHNNGRALRMEIVVEKVGNLIEPIKRLLDDEKMVLNKSESLTKGQT